jgi:hypothetical protein
MVAACLLFQSPAIAAGADGTGGTTNTRVTSKSPYAAWRAKREQAEKPDTSGHGHRAPHPQGQSRARRLPQ